MLRYRSLTIWNLRLDDVIRFRSPHGRIEGEVVELRLCPSDGYVAGTVLTRDAGFRPFRFTDADKVRRRLLSLEGILAGIDQPPDSERSLKGYQVKVGRERDLFWLQPAGETYEATVDMPVEPPFSDRDEADRARSWVTGMYPGVATLLQPVYLPERRLPAVVLSR